MLYICVRNLTGADRRSSCVRPMLKQDVECTVREFRCLVAVACCRCSAGVSAVGAGGWALLSRQTRQRLLPGAGIGPLRRLAFFNPNGVRAQGPRILKWQLSDRRAAWPESYPSPFRDRPPASASTARACASPRRACVVPGADARTQPADRSGMGGAVSPFSFSARKRDQPAGDSLEDCRASTPCSSLTTTTTIWMRGRRAAVAALPSAHRHAARQRHHTGARRAGPDRDGRRLGDRVDLGDGLVVHIEPTVHWSARGTGDRMHALWASFVVETGAQGLLRRRHRLRQRRHLPPRARSASRLALALLPIGAYEPRWFMRNNHMNPRRRCRRWSCAGAAQRAGPPLGHVPPHQRGDRAADAGSRRRSRGKRHCAGALPGAAAGRGQPARVSESDRATAWHPAARVAQAGCRR